MNEQYIQIGIDLGTTNSEIAINKNGKIEIIKNVFGDEYTPSVFGVDKSKNKVVGKRAYERLYKNVSQEEFNNYKAEIKRLMGTSEVVCFNRGNLKMNAEEISSEILKSLKEDVLRKHPDFNTFSAIITVPAYFSVLQTEATKRAGNLAGYKYVVLLQEPIAAAISYGFMNIKNENWLVYDLGGGTFDVALISSKNGILSVLSHNGDNFLGGKDIDWLIVDNVIVPKILETHVLKNFNRGADQYRSVFSKLKHIAETTKIYISQCDETLIEIEGIGEDDNGKEIFISFSFSSKELEKLIKPLIDRTVELSKETLKESGISNSLVKKIILVGGPTQSPYIKERLEEELKISVDSSIDPLTSIAHGACIFAISQRVPREIAESNIQKSNKDVYILSLNHETLTSETEETITGYISDLKDSKDEYCLQIQSESGYYSSQKVMLKNGKFFHSISIEENKMNLFWIYLFDKKGNNISIEPDSFTITHGLSISGAPIPHSIGVVILKKNIKSDFILVEVFEKIFEKGSILPLIKTERFKTCRRLRKSENKNSLWIKIGEGESEIPDRNTFVCELGIRGKDLPYDLPEGTDIDITIEVNESRELIVTAYVPLIDLTLNVRSTFKDEIIDIRKIEIELNEQIERADNVVFNCIPHEKIKIKDAINSVSVSLNNAHLDEDEKRKANKGLKDLKNFLDRLEKEKGMSQLINSFNVNTKKAGEIIKEYAKDGDRDRYSEQLGKIEFEGSKAIRGQDESLLSVINEQIESLISKVLFSNPSTWVYHFRQIIKNNPHFTSEDDAKYYIKKGEDAIELNDIDELKRCTHNLMLLIPKEKRADANNNLAGITR